MPGPRNGWMPMTTAAQLGSVASTNTSITEIVPHTFGPYLMPYNPDDAADRATSIRADKVCSEWAGGGGSLAVRVVPGAGERLRGCTEKVVPWPGGDMVAEHFFFFQAEDGIRDVAVTGVQTCALPISAAASAALLLAAGGGYMLTRQSTAPIERSMEQMRRFMADAAHELRTPITVLRTRAEVAASQDREPTRDAATLQAIEREATRLGEITGNLLTLARADAGEWPVAREALYLDDAVAGARGGVRSSGVGA